MENKHPKINTEALRVVRQAVRCPSELSRSDVERDFLRATKERLDRFGADIFLSEAQLAWLSKIAARMTEEIEGGAEKKPPHPAADDNGDLPRFEELAGE